MPRTIRFHLDDHVDPAIARASGQWLFLPPLNTAFGHGNSPLLAILAVKAGLFQRSDDVVRLASVTIAAVSVLKDRPLGLFCSRSPADA